MQVRDVMTEATVTDSTTDTLRSAAERMWRQQTGSLLVLENGRLAGILTERDLLRAVALGADPATATVDEAMTTEVFTVPPDMPLGGGGAGDGRALDQAPAGGGERAAWSAWSACATSLGIFAALAPGERRAWSTSLTSWCGSAAWPASSTATWTSHSLQSGNPRNLDDAASSPTSAA